MAPNSSQNIYVYPHRQTLLSAIIREASFCIEQWEVNVKTLAWLFKVLRMRGKCSALKQNIFTFFSKKRRNKGWKEYKNWRVGRSTVKYCPTEHDTAIVTMNSQKLLFPALGLPNTGPVNSQLWMKEGLIGFHPSLLNYQFFFWGRSSHCLQLCIHW